MLRTLPVPLCLLVTTGALADPAFLAGDRFSYERVKYDATGHQTEVSEVTWEVLESTDTGHRIRVDELLNGTPTSSVWTFDRDNNALQQEVGHCRNVSEPDNGRYRWPMGTGSTWSVDFDATSYCQYETLETKPLSHCEVRAQVVNQGSYSFLGHDWPTIAIERVVACSGPGDTLAGGIAIRWEKEELCPTLAVRCTFEYDWVLLGAGQWTPAQLAAYRAAPERQNWAGRVREVLRDAELK
jgi:hypothetical protein